MSISPEQRKEAAKRATKEVLYFYESEEASEKLYAILERNAITREEQRSSIVLEVANVVLGFYPVTKLPEVLTGTFGLDIRKTLALTADIVDYLAPLENRSASTAVVPEETLLGSKQEIAMEIAETEADFARIPKVHTMAADIDRARASVPIAPTKPTESVYSSTQAALLRESAATTTNKSTGRWESDAP
jgi:hypothetical protein